MPRTRISSTRTSADIGDFRRRQWEYEQVTQEMLNRPREMVRSVHQRLVERGYDGPAPVFADRWLSLFRRISSG